MDEDTGKMIIDFGSDSDAEMDVKRTGPDIAGSAYRESITSVDGFTRGPNGRVKFNKDTKKRRRENDEAEDVEMDVEAGSGKNKKNKRKSEVKLGHEFKAKVTHFFNVSWYGGLLITHV
jgi:ribosomal RNA-processing protein 12